MPTPGDIEIIVHAGEMQNGFRRCSANCRLCRGTGDFAAKRTIEDKRPEWNNRGHEREQRTANRPGPRDADPNQNQHEGNEEDAVDAANNANSKRQAGKIFQRHGNEEEDKKGHALNERDETQLTKRSHDHILSASA
jgi:hypothetical protein